MQGNIRSTFRALHDVVKAQGQAIRNLEAVSESKAQYTDVAVKLAGKADNSDVERWNEQLAAKIDRTDCEAMCERKLANFENVIVQRLSHSMTEVLNNMSSSLNGLRTEVSKQLEHMHDVLETRVSDVHRDMAGRVRAVEVRLSETLVDTKRPPSPIRVVPHELPVPTGVVMQHELDKVVHTMRSELERVSGNWGHTAEMQKNQLQVLPHQLSHCVLTDHTHPGCQECIDMQERKVAHLVSPTTALTHADSTV